MGQAELVAEVLKRLSFFNRVQILPLEVLDQRELGRLLLIDLTDQRGDTIQPGLGYQRTERFTLPTRIEGPYRVVVTTNFDGQLFELGGFAENNEASDDAVILVAATPRPNLQVAVVTASLP